MVDVTNDGQAVLKASCDETELLFPLASVGMILSKNDAELLWLNHDQIEYLKKTYTIYSMAELLCHDHHAPEEYILLLCEPAGNFAIMIEAIYGVITLDETPLNFPSYLPKQTYIISCHMIADGKLAYLIDFAQLLKQRMENK